MELVLRFKEGERGWEEREEASDKKGKEEGVDQGRGATCERGSRAIDEATIEVKGEVVSVVKSLARVAVTHLEPYSASPGAPRRPRKSPSPLRRPNPTSRFDPAPAQRSRNPRPSLPIAVQTAPANLFHPA